MNSLIKFISQLIFLSRWLQAPLYLGLALVLGYYVYEFGLGLIHLFMALTSNSRTDTVLEVLDLIDVVMIANLLIMVVIGGYQVFVSNLNLTGHPDHPEWLDEVNAGSMKVKLAVALISISSIHLLRTFMDVKAVGYTEAMWQVIIHTCLLLSAVAIAFTNKLLATQH